MKTRELQPAAEHEPGAAKRRVLCRALDILILLLCVALALMAFGLFSVSTEVMLLMAVCIAAFTMAVLLLTKYDAARRIRALREEALRSETILQNTIYRFASLVEQHDASDCGHVARVSEYVGLIAGKLRGMGYSKAELTDGALRNIALAAPVHDLGKIRIPESILLKPQRLTEEEYETVKAHAKNSAVAVRKTFTGLRDQSFIDVATDMALYHHEHWDGTGYPCGLAGGNIPISARILAVADVFDVAVNRRCYKDAKSADEGFAALEAGKGTQFDPCIVDVFIQSRAEVERIMLENAESSAQ